MSTLLKANNKKIVQSVVIGAARTYLQYFILLTNKQYQCKWFHRLIADKIDNIVNGKIKKLAVFLPPQHGKSTIISKAAPAYILGRDPNCRIASCSYSADRAQEYNRAVQRTIDDPIYKTIFPNTYLSGSPDHPNPAGTYVRNSDTFDIIGYAGVYRSVGVMGPLTGFTVDIGIIDDPIKDRMEAESRTYRNRVWDWYNDVFKTRMHNSSKQILVQTRWHEDDLAGRILASEPDWEVVSIPAICETKGAIESDPREVGEVLWPEKHEIEKILAIKSKNPRSFASLYQQHPTPPEGGIFKKDWWRFWASLPDDFDSVIMSWDCAFEGDDDSDFVVGQLWGKKGADAYLLDQVRGQWDFPETVNQIRQFVKRYPMVQEILIEKKANGHAIIQILHNEIPGIIPIVPEEGKESRAAAISHIVESGNIYLPAPVVAPWINEAIEYELSPFPNSVNDDIVDALTQAINRMYIKNTGFSGRVAI
jgi:predicted phage terminase large subunit-like protein